MSEPDATPPPVCDHDAHCPTCNVCTECYPHEPGTWLAEGVSEPCRGAAILKHLNDMDQLEQILTDIAGRSTKPRDLRHAARLLDDLGRDRDRMLGTGEL
jgi:hypothetical protein